MTKNELIAAVALEFIKEQLAQEEEGTQRFCILGLEESIVRSIAEAAIADSDTNNKVLIQISPLFDPQKQLPQSNRSDQSITHWRHCRLTEGKRAVLFAALHEELQRNNKSVEKITKIESDTLRGQYSNWIEMAGLTHAVLDQAKRTHLEAALRAANDTHAARTIETFSEFVIAIGESLITMGLPLQKAIDNALPSLRLPRYSGFFDRIPDKKRNSKAEWGKIFRRLHTRVRPLLVQENEKGDPISDHLRKNFAEIQDRLDNSDKRTIQDFLDSDPTLDTWSSEQAGLVSLDWRTISDLFEGITKTSVQSLGDKTIQFFNDEFDDLLDDDERSLLAASFPKEPSEDLQQFFESHREHLARVKKLSSTWERYIFRNPQTYPDFLTGLLGTIHHLRDRSTGEILSDNIIKVHIPKSREKSYWRSKNARVARYFAFRYRGLNGLLGDDVELDFGKLEDFYFPHPDDDLAKVVSGSRDARTIKFEVSLDPDGLNARLIFFWEMPVDALGTSMPDDLVNVANLNSDHALLSTADITRQSVSAKGAIQRISLDDIKTIRDVTNGNDGKLVAPNSESADRGSVFLSALDELSGIIDQNGISEIHFAFDEFLIQYSSAIRHWVTQEGSGLNSEAFLEQAEAYGRLLEALNNYANNDLARDRLWKEILRLGVGVVGAGSPAAIIAPWHPLRLAEIHIKAKQATDLIKKVLHANEDDIFRADLLFGQGQHELLSNYYPEVCVGFYDENAILLAAADTCYDYTLCEPPQKLMHSNGDDSLDIDPSVAARAFGTVGEQYLSLLPHERNNFSVVLYNAESKALPSALASELSSKVEQENELQCDLLLTHSDPKIMRRIYEQQNVAVSEESSSIMASEAARNFLSRLRVGFLDANEIPESDIARKADIVVLQDVVARNGKLEWKKSPGDRHPDLKYHCPARWSRRRPVGPADTATSVYLASPSQPSAGQIYLNSIHVYLEGDNARPGNVIPAREVTFRDSEIGDVFLQTHRIGEWVVNFDELVDRRLLLNNGVQVIRHIHDRNVNRNITVSTTSKPRLLHVLLRERIDRLDPNIIANSGDSVVERLINEANGISGQIVMRAARYGHYANELLGIVLSMEELRAGLGGRSLPIGWYFLDDFASWFGQREEQIADVMAIAPRLEDGKPVLMVAISEAKYVSSKGYKAQAKKSAKQLEETAARLGRALDPNHKRIDRDIWLHRLGDFIIEGMEPFDGSQMNGWDLHKWSDVVRQGNVTIKLAGFSHVFVHDDDEYVDAGGGTPLKGMPHCVQQIFDKPRIAQAFRNFAAGEVTTPSTEAQSSNAWADALVSSRSKDQVVDVAENDTQPPRDVSTQLLPEEVDEYPDTSDITDSLPEPEELNEEPVVQPSTISDVEHANDGIKHSGPLMPLLNGSQKGRLLTVRMMKLSIG